MKFDTPATTNPIDRGRVIGIPHDRIDGAAKVTGTAPYAYERHDAAPNAAYGWIVGSAIAKGRINAMDLRAAEAAPGVLGIVTHQNAGPLGKGNMNTAHLLGGPQIEHYEQAVALVIADTLENARDAARLVRIDYAPDQGRFNLAAERDKGVPPEGGFGGPADTKAGDFEAGFAKAAVKIDQHYTTPDQSHAMMEPHATIAAWNGDKLTLWTSNQMIAWSVGEMAATLKIPKENIRLVSPYIGGGFGAKLFLRADALLAALGARMVGRPVKVAIARPQIPNNTTHRPATIQRIRIGADRQGVIDAIAHEVWSGDLPGGGAETAAQQTRLLYRGPNRLTTHRLSTLDLPEGNAMRAPGEAVGLLALEVAMDELAEACGVDPVELRIRNDVQYDPEAGPQRPFSSRKLVECLREGAERFGWNRRNPKPGQVRDGRWLVGMGVASAFRNNLVTKSGARIGVDAKGHVTVETDMTDIGTGSYTIIGQTAAEMLGVPLDAVTVRLGDSRFPASSGSGGQWGGNSSTAGVYAAAMALRAKLAEKAGFPVDKALFEDGLVRLGNQSQPLGTLAGREGLWAEDSMDYGDLTKRYAQATFGAHFCEVGVDIDTAEVRVRRMGGAFAAGRILNPKSARSQVIGAMTMGVGAALMEELSVDTRFGFFVNHDMAEYLVPVHADIPHQDVLFIDELDDKSSPMKAKGVGELGICGAGAAVANAIYNATGVRLRDYPLTIDKILAASTGKRVA
ncbi:MULTISPECIES: aldehyde oxidoreductase molybdenum-binding subunit PaoC [Sphingobium]|uniref:Oxidoreductase n=1 Tax=Sphingobium fuliginis (strain ATCC 27551) TaxID=336203 RepID=A0ABQ1EKV1_SPHSA|nr:MULTISPECIES: aldehyde oxidoreductase molybdenum-binding subunit PaoC [Sphingobium]AJR22916.1 xanthine dehydrogenase [Sphingobium sp. YBL2]RYM01289.1 xanthine dehydrogenase family protein molybdopterin-binding subunit [Sphingobium fuliginis]UXC89978.1 xanthine dehydrogenase family protein molybdopterin-binding subunit [Sphingobium sp. RSMS]WDA38905.1 xanthine dehydrogenase family protein molybdopterin-binding subunit [Sphingobium sp. YC-XJ3]GFZ76513.1 oxidoreductase [Sphingobium fuliginis]